jgi:hypothetical protein
MSDPTRPATAPKAENLFLNLVFNLALPTLVMNYGSSERLLGPRYGLVVALLFPLGYGIYDYVRRRRLNFISAIGFVGVLISGGFGLLKLDGFWFAVKDGAMPALIGVAVLASLRAKEPLVHEILYNPQVIDVERVAARLTERNAHPAFAGLMRRSSYLIAAAMFISAALNYGFARWIIKSPPNTEAFNQELARMHWVSMLGLSLPVIAMMMYAMWRLFKGLEAITGLTFDEIMRQPPEQKKAAPDSGAAGDGKAGGA